MKEGQYQKNYKWTKIQEKKLTTWEKTHSKENPKLNYNRSSNV